MDLQSKLGCNAQEELPSAHTENQEEALFEWMVATSHMPLNDQTLGYGYSGYHTPPQFDPLIAKVSFITNQIFESHFYCSGDRVWINL